MKCGRKKIDYALPTTPIDTSCKWIPAKEDDLSAVPRQVYYCLQLIIGSFCFFFFAIFISSNGTYRFICVSCVRYCHSSLYVAFAFATKKSFIAPNGVLNLQMRQYRMRVHFTLRKITEMNSIAADTCGFCIRNSLPFHCHASTECVTSFLMDWGTSI